MTAPSHSPIRNLLLITTDQHRFDALGFMGHPDVRTPHLDGLAAEGVAFRRTYVTNPVCMPSRASLLLGQFPDAHGVRRNGIETPDQPWGVARVLRDHGWRTGMFGKTHFAPLRRDYERGYAFSGWRSGDDYYGFEARAITHDLKDYASPIPVRERPLGEARVPEGVYPLDDYADWMAHRHPELYELAVREGLPADREQSLPELWTSELPPKHHQSTWIADRALEFIEQQREQPFFAWVSFVDPHHPFNAPRPYRDLYDADALAPPVWEDGELDRRSPYHRRRHELDGPVWREHWREYRAQYYGMISLIDDQVGRMLRRLEDLGLADSTAVVFTSDHGEMLGDHGLARKGLFHYEPLIRVPLVVRVPGSPASSRTEDGLAQTVDVPPTLLELVGISPPPEYQGVSLLPWCTGDRTDSPRPYALVTNGGEGPHYDPWPELRTLVTDRWKLQVYVREGHVELDDLREDPEEWSPLDPERHAPLVRDLLMRLVDASSDASVWGRHIGRW